MRFDFIISKKKWLGPVFGMAALLFCVQVYGQSATPTLPPSGKTLELMGQEYEPDFPTYVSNVTPLGGSPPAGASIYWTLYPQSIINGTLTNPPMDPALMQYLAANYPCAVVELAIDWANTPYQDNMVQFERDIANGLDDPLLLKIANFLKSYPHMTFLIRLEYEVTPGTEANTNPGGYDAPTAQYPFDLTAYAPCFHYIKNYLNNVQGVTNALYVFHTEVGYASAGLYPDTTGNDTDVDLVGWSVWNQEVGMSTNGQTTPYTVVSAGVTVENAWLNDINWVRANHPTKPLMICESATQTDAASTQGFLDFMTDYFNVLEYYDFRAFVYINTDWNQAPEWAWANPPWIDSRVDVNSSPNVDTTQTLSYWLGRLTNSRYIKYVDCLITTTPTSTMTATSTNTPTNTATDTATNTATNTPIQTATNTATDTSTHTATNTMTNTTTAVATNTFTNTATNTATSTLTDTFTATATYTYTNMITPTATNTPTNTVSNNLGTPTFTNTPTNTATVTPTFTWTNIITLTSTNTFTDTPAASITNGATNTLTITLTPILTLTLTPTVISTVSSSATPAANVTISQQVSAASAQAGDKLTYSITITVTGNSVTNLIVTDNLPSGLTFSGYLSSPTGTNTSNSSSSQLNWNLPGTLAPGTYQISYQATLNSLLAGGTLLTNTAQVTYSGLNTPLTSSVSVQVLGGSYTVKVNVYNSAGEVVKQILTANFSQPVDNISLTSDTITTLHGPGSTIQVYYGGILIGTWDGSNDSGDPVSNGVYQLKIDSIASIGIDTSVLKQVMVGRQLSNITATIFNSVGEAVKTIYNVVDDANALQVQNMSLSADVMSLGATPQGNGTNLQIFVITSGTPVTLTWDGSNNLGTNVTPGTYEIELHWDNGEGETTDISRSILVVEGGGTSGVVTARPNELTPSNGMTTTFNGTGIANAASLKVKIYTIAGELVQSIAGGPGATASWTAAGIASGIYIAVVDVQSADGGVIVQKTLKMLVLH